jgi:hypothetical protein
MLSVQGAHTIEFVYVFPLNFRSIVFHFLTDACRRNVRGLLMVHTCNNISSNAEQLQWTEQQ